MSITETTILCVTCDKPTHSAGQTCLNCTNHARNVLTDIAEGHALLPDAIKTISGISYSHTSGRTHDTIVPGGDALIMLSPGTAESVTAILDHREDDAPSLAGELATIEDDWRHTLGTPAADYDPAVEKSINWMVANIAAITQRHPDWPGQIEMLRGLRARVTTITGTSDAPEKVEGGYCLADDCATNDHGDKTQLIRRPHPKDGLPDVAECPTCERTYDELQLALARRQHAQERAHHHPDALVTAEQAATLLGITHSGLRNRIQRDHISPVTKRRGVKLYRLADLYERINA